MLGNIIQILLVILLVIQIFVLLHLAYMNYKRNKEDKAFWDRIHKELDDSTKEFLTKLNEETDKMVGEGAKNEQEDKSL